MSDRQSYDPFAPPQSSVVHDEHQVPDESDQSDQQEAEEPDEASSLYALSLPGDNLDSMRRVDLVEIAKSEGIASYGTQAELAARIRKHRQAT